MGFGFVKQPRHRPLNRIGMAPSKLRIRAFRDAAWPFPTQPSTLSCSPLQPNLW